MGPPAGEAVFEHLHAPRLVDAEARARDLEVELYGELEGLARFVGGLIGLGPEDGVAEGGAVGGGGDGEGDEHEDAGGTVHGVVSFRRQD